MYNKKVIASKVKEQTIMTNNDSTSVKIKLITKIRPNEGESETYEMWLQGSYIEKSGSAYLRYEEVQNEQSIRTTVKLGKEQALIIRGGAVNMRLPFHIKDQQLGHYDSEFGSLPLMTHTHTLDFQSELEDEKSGRFSVQYDLIMGGQSVGNYTVDIHFTEVTV